MKLTRRCPLQKFAYTVAVLQRTLNLRSQMQIVRTTSVLDRKRISCLFQALKEAYLTHPFHCCAFKYPEQHDPKKHALMEENMKKLCPEEATTTTTSYDTGQFFEPHVKMRRKRNYEENGDGWWNSAFE